VAVPEPDLLRKPWDFLMIEDLPNHPLGKNSPAVKAGMISVLCVPIRFGGRLQAGVNFFSRQQHWFSESDVPLARRIARASTETDRRARCPLGLPSYRRRVASMA
jgi:hypothetical protein